MHSPQVQTTPHFLASILAPTCSCSVLWLLAGDPLCFFPIVQVTPVILDESIPTKDLLNQRKYADRTEEPTAADGRSPTVFEQVRMKSPARAEEPTRSVTNNSKWCSNKYEWNHLLVQKSWQAFVSVYYLMI